MVPSSALRKPLLRARERQAIDEFVSFQSKFCDDVLLAALNVKATQLNAEERDALMNDASAENHIVQRGHADLPHRNVNIFGFCFISPFISVCTSTSGGRKG